MTKEELNWKRVPGQPFERAEEATLPDGRVARISHGLAHRSVLVIDGSRVGTFVSRDGAKGRAEKIAKAAS